MGNVFSFPTPDDRATMQTAVSVFLMTQNGRTRQQMLKTARAILDRYGISKLIFDDYTVKSTQDPGWSRIVGKRYISGRICPGCGADIYEWPGRVKILSIDEGCRYDEVSYGCRCGLIFKKKEAIQK